MFPIAAQKSPTLKRWIGLQLELHSALVVEIKARKTGGDGRDHDGLEEPYTQRPLVNRMPDQNEKTRQDEQTWNPLLRFLVCLIKSNSALVPSISVIRMIKRIRQIIEMIIVSAFPFAVALLIGVSVCIRNHPRY